MTLGPTGIGKRLVRVPLLLLASVFVFSVATLLIFRPSSGVVYVPWDQVTLTQWASEISAIILGAFLPGFLVLDIVGQRRKETTNFYLVFSFLFSAFIVTSAGLLAYFITGRWMTSTLLVILNAALFGLWILVCRGETSCKRPSTKYLLAIVSLSAFFFGLAILHGSFIWGDQRTFNGRSLSWIASPFPSIQGAAQPFYPWWFVAYLATLFGASALPPINNYTVIVFLNMIPILAYYLVLTAKEAWNKSRAAAIATFLAFFSAGFGWLYSIAFGPLSFTTANGILRLGLSTYDIVVPTSFLSAFPDISSGLVLLGLPCLLGVLAIALSETRFVLRDSLIVASCTALALLSDSEPGIVLAAIFTTLVLFGKVRDFAVEAAFLFGLITVSLIDLLVPAKFYNLLTVTVFGLNLSVQVLGVVGCSCAIGARLLLVRTTLLHRLKQGVPGRLRELANSRLIWLAVGMSLIYVYALAFLIFDGFVFPQFSFKDSIYTVPWYLYPLKLGMVGLLAVGFVTGSLLWKWHQTQRAPYVLLICVPIMIVLARLSGYAEYRMIKYLPLFLSPIAALFIVRLAKLVKGSRADFFRVLVVLVLLLVSVPSMGLYYAYEYTSQNPNHYGLVPRRVVPTASEIGALEFLSTNYTNGAIGTFPEGYANQYSPIADFTRIPSLNASKFLPVFGVSNIEDFASVAQSIDLRYLYLDKQVEQVVNTSYPNSIAYFLTKVLPPTFSNNSTGIYGLPALSPASQTPDLQILGTEPSGVFYPSSILIQNGDPTAWTVGYTNNVSNGSVQSFNGSSYVAGPAVRFEYQSKTNAEGAVNFVYSNPAGWNLSATYALSFWLLGNNSNATISIYLIDNYPSHMKWTDVSLNFTGWKRFVLPLDQMNTEGWDSTVKRIEFDPRFTGDGTYHSIAMADISLIEGQPILYSSLMSILAVSLSGSKYGHTIESLASLPSYATALLPYDPPAASTKDYTDWVRSGGRLIVLASNGFGAFSQLFGSIANDSFSANAVGTNYPLISLPDLNVKPLVPNANTSIISHYSRDGRPGPGFMFEKSIGSGTIYYVSAEPIFSQWLITPGLIFPKISQLAHAALGQTGLPTSDGAQRVQTNSTAPPYTIAMTSISGNVSLSTDHIQFQLPFVQLRVNGNEGVTYNFSDASVIGRGGITLALTNFKGLLGSDGMLTLSSSVASNQILSIDLQSNSSLVFSSASQGSTMLLNGPLRATLEVEMLSGTTLDVDGRLTKVSIEGQTVFNKAYGIWSVSHDLLAGDLVEFTGNTSFEVLFTDRMSYVYMEDPGKMFSVNLGQQPLMYLVNISSTGSYSHIVLFSPDTWDEWSLPWTTILTSPVNIVLLGALITCFLGNLAMQTAKVRLTRNQRGQGAKTLANYAILYTLW